MAGLPRPGMHAPFRPPPAKITVPRLPPGSCKSHEWDGKWWHGTMTVLGREFETRAPSESLLLHRLDKLYREWLHTQDEATKAAHSAHLKK